MKKQDRIRICGARQDRLAKRILLGGGLMALYSVCFGLVPGLLMILIWIGLAAATARAFYSARHQRRIRREQQIAAEVQKAVITGNALKHWLSIRPSGLRDVGIILPFEFR